jgi:hypothetical protein
MLQVVSIQINKKRQLMLPSFRVDRNAVLSSFCASFVVFLVEFLNATCSVHDFLCASVERVAFRANFNVQCRLANSGLGLEGIAAAAGYGDFIILWVNVCFHLVFLASVIGAAKSTHA